jgi:hypothetical protein
MAEKVVKSETRLLSLDEIKPYWRNPRRIPPEAIQAVRSSIERFGYRQPIVVDENNVVVVGHTRLLALQEMGVEKVEVYVARLSEEKIREFRVIDNKTSEMSSWDNWALVLELREFDVALLASYFPEINLEIERVSSAHSVTDAEVEVATEEHEKMKEQKVLHTTMVKCPSCFYEFEVRTDSLPGLSRTDIQQLNNVS